MKNLCNLGKLTTSHVQVFHEGRAGVCLPDAFHRLGGGGEGVSNSRLAALPPLDRSATPPACLLRVCDLRSAVLLPRLLHRPRLHLH